MSRRRALKKGRGEQLIRALRVRGIPVRSPSMRDVAEEASGAYKAVEEEAEAGERPASAGGRPASSPWWWSRDRGLPGRLYGERRAAKRAKQSVG